MTEITTSVSCNKKFRWKRLKKELKRDKFLLLLLAPWAIYYVIFQYIPTIGLVIAFKDYSVFKGIFGSPWANNFGLEHFMRFLTNPLFPKLLKNTLLLSAYSLLWSTPLTILFALFINEVKNMKFKKIVQTFTYVPHFISTTVICGIMAVVLSPSNGIVNHILVNVLHIVDTPVYLLGDPRYFRGVYIFSGLWQGLGFGTIVYLAAIAGVDPNLYEACTIDGGGRLAKVRYITMPAIVPTIVVLTILNVGKLLDIGAEKVLLLYNPLTYETADVFKTYIYRVGLGQGQFASGTAIGLFNSLISLILIAIANRVARNFSETSLW